MLIVKLICKECYIEKYGELPHWAYGPLYEMTEEIKQCEICGKRDYLVYTTEKLEKEVPIDWNKPIV